MSLERFSKRGKLPAPVQKTIKTVLFIGEQSLCPTKGSRGAVFAIERLGHRVIFIPTATVVAGETVFTEANSNFLKSAGTAFSATDIDAVLVGNLYSEDQATLTEQLLRDFVAVNTSLKTLLSVSAVRELHLAGHTDSLGQICSYLIGDMKSISNYANFPADCEAELIAAARSLEIERVLITNAPAMRRNSHSYLLVGPSGSTSVEHSKVPGSDFDYGYLLEALMLVRLLEGQRDEDALKVSAASVFELAAKSVRMGAQELLYSQNQEALIRPMALVNDRRVVEGSIPK
ncbi:carbohydrate kinase family protein [Flexibacterium corallicola]|uniref:hypothetical protein n=1 Tax=Flexibacterium corallicola TaxID=3037259 RepID=UPI00286F144E|nr:hypothetical protein [Pseudovibrio sp. M1P-2-3]